MVAAKGLIETVVEGIRLSVILCVFSEITSFYYLGWRSKCARCVYNWQFCFVRKETRIKWNLSRVSFNKISSSVLSVHSVFHTVYQGSCWTACCCCCVVCYSTKQYLQHDDTIMEIVWEEILNNISKHPPTIGVLLGEGGSEERNLRIF